MLFILFLHPLAEFWALTGQSRSIVLNAGADFALVKTFALEQF